MLNLFGNHNKTSPNSRSGVMPGKLPADKSGVFSGMPPTSGTLCAS